MVHVPDDEAPEKEQKCGVGVELKVSRTQDTHAVTSQLQANMLLCACTTQKSIQNLTFLHQGHSSAMATDWALLPIKTCKTFNEEKLQYAYLPTSQ